MIPFLGMAEEVTIRELRNNGGAVVDRVERGESLIVTRDGKPVAELRPLPRPTRITSDFLAQWAKLPPIDAQRFRRDVDDFIDMSL